MYTIPIDHSSSVDTFSIVIIWRIVKMTMPPCMRYAYARLRSSSLVRTSHKALHIRWNLLLCEIIASMYSAKLQSRHVWHQWGCETIDWWTDLWLLQTWTPLRTPGTFSSAQFIQSRWRPLIRKTNCGELSKLP